MDPAPLVPGALKRPSQRRDQRGVLVCCLLTTKNPRQKVSAGRAGLNHRSAPQYHGAVERHVYDPSPASLQPLRRMYEDAVWDPETGQLKSAVPDEATFAAAVARGVMFDDARTRDHDEWVADAKAAAAETEPAAVESAFVASLSTRRLDLRSALASWVLADRLPLHSQRLEPGQWCGLCGTEADLVLAGLNDLSYARFFGPTWAPIRQTVSYAAFDLQQLVHAPSFEPTPADTELGRRVIATLRGLPPGTNAKTGAQALEFLPGNQREREMLLDALGVCGILESPDHRGHFAGFVPSADRAMPGRFNVEMAYPACWWRATYGLNDAALHALLPSLTK
jgi:hypothetical protein